MVQPSEIGNPTPDVQRLLARAWKHLKNREYCAARESFENAVALQATLAVAWEGLSSAARYLDDLSTSRAAAERAYREFLDQNDFRGAARAAMSLAVYHEAYRGESAIANGWFERARSLLESCPAAPERAWLAFWEAHVFIHLRGDVTQGERSLETAFRLNDTCPVGGEFDLLARGLVGLQAVNEGHIDDGLRRLDEATTAAVVGELRSPDTIGWAYCYILAACENVRDFGRASQWMQRAWESEREIGIPHYGGFCRSHYVGVLTWCAEYERAEQETEKMRHELGRIAPIYMPFGDIRLGEIRRRQGRTDEAAALLEPQIAHPLAAVSLASLALDTGRPRVALELAERFLRHLSPTDRLRRLHGLDLVVRARADLGDSEGLRAALTELEAIASSSGTPLMQAIVEEGRALRALTDRAWEDARCLLEDAVDDYDRGNLPYEAAAARLRLGDTLHSLGREDAARSNFENALSSARRIGAAGLAQRATAALTRLNAAGARRHTSGLTTRELEVLALVAHGVSNHEIGERMSISEFTVKRHVANILTKLSLPTRAAAAAYAIREGVIR